LDQQRDVDKPTANYSDRPHDRDVNRTWSRRVDRYDEYSRSDVRRFGDSAPYEGRAIGRAFREDDERVIERAPRGNRRTIRRVPRDEQRFIERPARNNEGPAMRFLPGDRWFWTSSRFGGD
jgi:hypothetical protein